jgi:hypothetical protein
MFTCLRKEIRKRVYWNNSQLTLAIGGFFFLYMLLLTYNIPYFWEDLLFLEGAYSQPRATLLAQTFTLGTGNFSHPGVPLLLLLLNAITAIVGEHALLFRIVRSLFFSGILVFFYILLRKFDIPRTSALVMTTVAGFSYPLFLTTFFIPRPEIFGIFWEYCGLILFFHIFFEGDKLTKQSRYLHQAGCFILLFIAMKMFSPSYIIIPVLIIFILVMNYRKIKTFAILILLLTAVYFPLSTKIIHGNVGSYTLGTESFNYMFSLGNTWSFFSFNNLYYKTVFEILSPFGLFVIVFGLCGVLYLMVLRINKKEEKILPWSNLKEKGFVVFMCLMVLFNVIFIFAAPDPATRYMVFFIMPVLSLMVFFMYKGIQLFQMKKKFRTIFTLLLIICLCLMVTYNIALSVMFRFTWGSAFIGMDKVSSFIESLPDEKRALFYYSGTPADEYAPIILVNGTFIERNNTLIFEKYWQEQVNREEFAQVNEEKQAAVYIAKRVSSFGSSSYPPYNFTDQEFTLVTTIEGENSILDRFFLKITNSLGVSYDFNTFYIYKWVGNNRNYL